MPITTIILIVLFVFCDVSIYFWDIVFSWRGLWFVIIDNAKYGTPFSNRWVFIGTMDNYRKNIDDYSKHLDKLKANLKEKKNKSAKIKKEKSEANTTDSEEQSPTGNYDEPELKPRHQTSEVVEKVITKEMQDRIDDVWRKGTIVENYPPDKFRKDICGAWMCKIDFRNENSSVGWDIAYGTLLSNGGEDALTNMIPLHWQNYLAKNDDKWYCVVTSDSNSNVLMPQKEES